MKQVYIILYFFITSAFVFHAKELLAQQNECGAAAFFKKNSSFLETNQGKKCIEVEIVGSKEKIGKEFFYRWDFGDNSTQFGKDVKHCYEHYGRHFITLDLIDPKNGLVIQNELSKEITLSPPLDLDYATDTLNHPFAHFQYDQNQIPDVRIDKIFWKIEDEFFCGMSAKHKFKKEGFHVLKIGVVGSSEKQKNLIGCTFMGIFIKPNSQ